jgi:hypothetical protein
MSSAAQPANVIPFPNQWRTRSQALPAGDAGVKQTIAVMQQLAVGTEGALHPALRAMAIQLVRGAAARDDYAQAAAIFHWVKNNIEFRGEYDELLQTPLVTAQLRAGDCDDHATLIYALLAALGIKAQFITVATDPSDPQKQFSHVFASAWIRAQNGWLPLDTTVERSFPGWQPEQITRIQAWADVKGMGDFVNPGPAIAFCTLPLGAIALIQQAGNTGVQLATAMRNTGSSANFSLQRMPGGVTATGGITPTTLLLCVGGLLAGALLLGRRR